jgi:hypothetical protein
MRVAVNCPNCKRPMATSAAFAGQTIACPNCRREFLFQPPAAVPPPAAATVPSGELVAAGTAKLQLESVGVATHPGAQSATAISTATAKPNVRSTAVQAPAPPLPPALPPGRPSAVVPIPAAGTAPPPPAAPSAPAVPVGANTARFKTAATSTATLVPAADGKLPGLLLADGETVAAGVHAGEKGVPLWLACLAIVGSTLLSLLLLVGDGPVKQSVASKHAEAREQLAQFFGNEGTILRPYQILLREAQQAHSRGDRATERQRYRQVLALLRSEKRSKSETVTGIPSEDELLAQWLSVLLSNE